MALNALDGVRWWGRRQANRCAIMRPGCGLLDKRIPVISPQFNHNDRGVDTNLQLWEDLEV